MSVASKLLHSYEALFSEGYSRLKSTAPDQSACAEVFCSSCGGNSSAGWGHHFVPDSLNGHLELPKQPQQSGMERIEQ